MCNSTLGAMLNYVMKSTKKERGIITMTTHFFTLNYWKTEKIGLNE